MTNEGVSWVIEQHNRAVSYHTPQEEVDFWLRAFCDEVERRAKALPCFDSRCIAETQCSHRRIEAFDDLRTSFLSVSDYGEELEGVVIA